MRAPAFSTILLTLMPLALAGCVTDSAAAQDTQPAASAQDTRAEEPDEIGKGDPMLADAGVAHAVVKESFVTAVTPDDNIDSPAAWRAPDGKTWLFATAKEGKGLVVYDGDSGATLRTVGTQGKASGQFNRANGIFVQPLADTPGQALLFVVERDNRRVQVLALPSLRTLGTFGEGELHKPYGLWVRPQDGGFEVLVTDAYMSGEDAQGEEIVPPLAQLGRRVQGYHVETAGEALTARNTGAFGDTGPAGAIRIPESLWGDVANDRLLIAEEDIATGTAVREYTLDGRYRGRTLGADVFKAQAEGIALWQCPDGSGYWIATDQFKDRSLFHVYDRRSLAHVGAFAGAVVGNTDGIWLHQAATARFPAGVFYAVHDDQAVAAFDWREVAQALRLPATCVTP
jgi:3-phytase